MANLTIFWFSVLSEHQYYRFKCKIHVSFQILQGNNEPKIKKNTSENFFIQIKNYLHKVYQEKMMHVF